MHCHYTGKFRSCAVERRETRLMPRLNVFSQRFLEGQFRQLAVRARQVRQRIPPGAHATLPCSREESYTCSYSRGEMPRKDQVPLSTILPACRPQAPP